MSAEQVEKRATQAMQCCDYALYKATLPCLTPSRYSHVDSPTPLYCDVISHAKKEICDISGAKRDFEFIFSAKESLDHIVYVCQKSQFCKNLTCQPVL